MKEEKGLFPGGDIAALRGYAVVCSMVFCVLIALNVQHLPDTENFLFSWTSFFLNVMGLLTIVVLFFQPGWWPRCISFKR
ncbi:MAG: hypothetical protein LBG74_03430 [Spirochaetaceae bacterium]|jgi:hypothetical protein|nr:hypothetical protein [Spirochaetaceae bacterium]